MDQPTWNEDFADVVKALNDAHVEFLIVGAHALAVHGLPRATGDLDILINPTPDNAQRTIQALVRFGAPIAAHAISAADFEIPGMVYQMGLPPRRIDLLTEITGVTFDEAWKNRKQIVLQDVSMQVLGREALLQNKRATARPKDLVDVRALESQDEAESEGRQD